MELDYLIFDKTKGVLGKNIDDFGSVFKLGVLDAVIGVVFGGFGGASSGSTVAIDD